MKNALALIVCQLLFSTLYVNAQNYQINSPENDAEESAGFTTVMLNSPVIDLTADPTNPKNMKQLVGLRFTDVAVERGAPLSNCYLVFHVDQPASKISMLSITGEKVANAEPFQSINRNLSSRIRTKARMNWNNVEAWTQAGEMMKSPDISTVITEITSQNDWKSGNSLVLFIEGNGQRHASAYDKNPEAAIQLVLNDASGSRFKRPAVIVQQQPVKQSVTEKTTVVRTDECNIPEPPVGVARSAYLQGNMYMEKADFKSAEARYSMAIDNLKHPKLFIARAAARHLLDRFSDAQDDLTRAVEAGVSTEMAKKCFEDLVQSNKNFSDVHETFEACFTRNVRNLPVPPCPIRITVGNGKASLFMDTKYENTEQRTGEYGKKPYNSMVFTTEWVLDPGEFHACNPNVDTSINPKNVKMSTSAKTAGWFEIPVKYTYTSTYLNGKEVVASKVVESNNWYLVGFLVKLHTGETTVDGGFYNAQGNSNGLRIGLE